MEQNCGKDPEITLEMVRAGVKALNARDSCFSSSSEILRAEIAIEVFLAMDACRGMQLHAKERKHSPLVE